MPSALHKITSVLKHRSVAASLFFAVFLLAGNTSVHAADNPTVLMKTDLGEITIEIYSDKAPITAENFLTYVRDGFYDGTIFHRVIPGFVVQGGGYTFDYVEKETRDPIKNEANNGLLNETATLSMARTYDPDSATAQFFINLNHNTNLDYSDENPGYAVFGKVTNGMDVVNAIVKLPRGRYQEFPEAPKEGVRILTATIVE